MKASSKLNLVAITTEKDITKIKKEYHEKISVLKIKLEWRNNEFRKFLINNILNR